MYLWLEKDKKVMRERRWREGEREREREKKQRGYREY